MAGRPSEAVWVEKYRPASLKDMVGQEAIVPLLRSYAEKGSMPHLLFAGPPGTGKTTAALALARDLFGAEWRQNFLELNASVTGETPVLVRTHGAIRRTTMAELAREYIDPTGSDRSPTPALEVLSLDEKLKVTFKPASMISRHRVPRVARLAVEGGVVRLSPDHSVVIVSNEGRIEPRSVSGLRIGDSLISFKTVLEGQPVELDLAPHAPATHVRLHPGRAVSKNPTVHTVLGNVPLDPELAWAFGDYAAEGAAIPTSTSGNVVFTHAYPTEVPETNRLGAVFGRLGFHTKTHLTKSGYLLERGIVRYSSIQLSLASVQWMRFFRANFYAESGGEPKNGHSKVAPSFIFDAPREERLSFLKGYSGDADGTWGRNLRYTSTSSRLLVDVAWLARVSGLESSNQEGWGTTNVRWPKSGSYAKPNLIPAGPVVNFLKGLGPGRVVGNWRYTLRHSLYHKRCPRALKTTVLEALSTVRSDRLSSQERETLVRLQTLASSDLHALRITDIQVEDAEDYLYDLSVPGAQMFWGGTIPLLLHNSDQRGIDTVRTTIKQYARTSPLGEVGFKILFLDEADNLTSEAQASLRRLMERYSGSCRFILSANYSSRIIEPIQSRCAVFRFRSYSPAAVRTLIERVAKGEGKKITPDALETILSAAAGDMRRAVNLLQLTATHSDTVTADTVKEYATVPLRREVEAMLGAALAGNFREARDRLYGLFTERGVAGEDILRAIHSYLPDISDAVLSPREKVRLVEYLGEVDFRLAQGASDRIQMEAILAHLAAERPGVK
jgi:replication factor C small subunit